jgi:hypothetical protein
MQLPPLQTYTRTSITCATDRFPCERFSVIRTGWRRSANGFLSQDVLKSNKKMIFIRVQERIYCLSLSCLVDVSLNLLLIVSLVWV